MNWMREGTPPDGKTVLFKYDGKIVLGHFKARCWYDHSRRTREHSLTRAEEIIFSPGIDKGPIPLFLDVECWMEFPEA